VIESQTYEDPVILAMNLMDNREENKALLKKWIGSKINKLKNYMIITGPWEPAANIYGMIL